MLSAIKDFLWNCAKSFFNNEIQALVHVAHCEYRAAQRKKQEELEFFRVHEFIDKPVIVISNAWDTPVIGFGLRIEFVLQAGVPILCVRNYLDNKEYLCMGQIYHFTQSRLNALLRLDSFELCSFIYGESIGVLSQKHISNERLGKEEIQKLLETNGFFTRLQQYHANLVEQKV